MSRFRQLTCAAVTLALAFSASAVPASVVSVPDDYLTVQGAIDSTTADTIRVATGEYPEDVTVHRDVVLLARELTGPYVLGYSYPRLRSFHASSDDGGWTVGHIRLIGFHVRGPATFVHDGSSNSAITFEMCRLDAGLTAAHSGNPFAHVRVRGCLVFGASTVHFYYPDLQHNAFLGGGLSVSGNGGVVVQGNYIEGPGDIGLRICCSDGVPLAEENVVRGFRVGIAVPNGATLARNTVTNCSEDGIQAAILHGIVRVGDNIVRSCAGDGIEILGDMTSAQVVGNTVDSVGGVGIKALAGVPGPHFVRNNTVRTTGDHGIWVGFTGAVSNNLVLGAGGDGIRTLTDFADSNVVGRSGSAGIRSGGVRLLGNTVFLNMSSGLVISSGSGTAVENNISYGNLGYGLDATASTAPALACNDWFSNAAGATAGVTPGASDLAADPRFCDLPANEVSLAATSPLLSAGACGLIGARGLGCASQVVAVGTPSVARFSVNPVPARGAVQLSWEADDAPSRLEVFDVTGSRRFDVELPGGAGEFRWDATDRAGQLVPTGVYFVRRTCRDRVEGARVVIQR